MNVKIEQLDESGNVYREFTYWAVRGYELQDRLDRIRRAYNLDATRVTVDGLPVDWTMV